MQTSRISVSLERLYLDPNNYRLRDERDYREVSQDQFFADNIQQRTYRLICGRSDAGIQDLVTSFTSNGYLSFEPIQVRRYSDEKYLVIEGNRRTATLKYLFGRYQEGADIGRMDSAIFSNIEVLVIDEQSAVQHLIAMGLHHIGGKKKWDSVNQAKLIRDLRDIHHLTEDEIKDALGLSRRAVNKSLRTLALLDSYKRSDFGDQFRSDMFSYFEEIIGSPELKEWLKWDDDSMTCGNRGREERLFSWLSRNDSLTGEVKPPIITKGDDLRVLSKFITDSKAVELMEETGSVTKAYALSSSAGKNRVNHSIEVIDKEISNLRMEDVFTKSHQGKISQLSDALRNLSAVSISLSEKPQLFYPASDTHFASLNIIRYKGLQNLLFDDFRQVNLFVGDNNSGKTMLLEAISAISTMNDITAYVDMERFRCRLGDKISLPWILEKFEDINISATYNSCPCSFRMEKYSDDDVPKTGYVQSLRCVAGVDDDVYSSVMHVYSGTKYDLRYQQIRTLCNTVMTSPYRYDPDRLFTAHGEVVSAGKFGLLLDFIRETVDDSISDIQLVSTPQGRRFIVTSANHSHGLDLARYGEGLQRIFEMALYIISCSGGCVLIDEIESGIHTSLMYKFIDFVYRLAKDCNVQLFITTHSKESVDTLASVVDAADFWVARLERGTDGVVVKKSEGERIKALLENSDIDIR